MMTAQIQIHSSTSPLSLEQLSSFTRQKIAAQKQAIEFALAIDPHELFILAIFPSDIKIAANCAPGQFFEGLWEETVFEIFLGSLESESYSEINLAPHGAWWVQNFSSYRNRCEGEIPKVSSYIEFTSQHWKCFFRITKKELKLPDKDKIRLNASGVISNKEKHLFSFSQLPPGKVDFHQKNLRAKVLF